MIQQVLDALRRVAELGGPVVVILLITSVATLALILFKIWQFRVAGVGRHTHLMMAASAMQAGDSAAAQVHLQRSSSYLLPVIQDAVDNGAADRQRLEAEAELRFAKLERGLRAMDSIAQIAPLLGLFGTVLGMIDAFQALQEAGSQVDPSILAGGIWVALLTTAAGLAVAMPTALVLSWLEGRMAADRVIADAALSRVLAPKAAVPLAVAHGA